jgi:hypothetical protein
LARRATRTSKDVSVGGPASTHLRPSTATTRSFCTSSLRLPTAMVALQSWAHKASCSGVSQLATKRRTRSVPRSTLQD